MKKFEEYKAYIYLALLFGFIFVFLIPPFQSPDEDSHFKKAYQISKGNFYPTVKNNKKGNYFPKEMESYINDKLSYIGDRDKKYSYSQMVLDQYLKMNYDNKIFNSYSTNSIIPITYIAPATGILFSKICAKIFGLEAISTSFMLYFARIFSLFASVAITAIAIKITPVFKKTFTIVALIPMFLYLYSMVTYDNVLNSLVLITLAIMLKISFDNKINDISKKYIIILSLIGVVLLNVKTIYFLIYLLMFSIPLKKYHNKKDMLKKALIIIGIILVLTLVLKMPLIFQKVTTTSSSLSGKQLNFVLKHPFTYLNILFTNIMDQRFFQLSSMVGMFGLIDTYNPMPIIFLSYLNIFVIALVEGSTDKFKISKNMKILAVVYVILGVIAVFSAMYINWTPEVTGGKIGGREISGVQGRYFLPLLMPFLLIFSNKRINDNKFFKMTKDNYLLLSIILLIISVSMVLLRYWI